MVFLLNIITNQLIHCQLVDSRKDCGQNTTGVGLKCHFISDPGYGRCHIEKVTDDSGSICCVHKPNVDNDYKVPCASNNITGSTVTSLVYILPESIDRVYLDFNLTSYIIQELHIIREGSTKPFVDAYPVLLRIKDYYSYPHIIGLFIRNLRLAPHSWPYLMLISIAINYFRYEYDDGINDDSTESKIKLDASPLSPVYVSGDEFFRYNPLQEFSLVTAKSIYLNDHFGPFLIIPPREHYQFRHIQFSRSSGKTKLTTWPKIHLVNNIIELACSLCYCGNYTSNDGTKTRKGTTVLSIRGFHLSEFNLHDKIRFYFQLPKFCPMVIGLDLYQFVSDRRGMESLLIMISEKYRFRHINSNFSIFKFEEIVVDHELQLDCEETNICFLIKNYDKFLDNTEAFCQNGYLYGKEIKYLTPYDISQLECRGQMLFDTYNFPRPSPRESITTIDPQISKTTNKTPRTTNTTPRTTNKTPRTTTVTPAKTTKTKTTTITTPVNTYITKVTAQKDGQVASSNLSDKHKTRQEYRSADILLELYLVAAFLVFVLLVSFIVILLRISRIGEAKKIKNYAVVSSTSLDATTTKRSSNVGAPKRSSLQVPSAINICDDSTLHGSNKVSSSSSFNRKQTRKNKTSTSGLNQPGKLTR